MARSSLSFLFLLLTITTTTIAEQTESPASSHAQDNLLINELALLDNALFDMTACMSSVQHAKVCVNDIFKSLQTSKVGVSRECCNAVSDVADKCLSVSGSSLADKIGKYCYDFGAPPSSPPSAATPSPPAFNLPRICIPFISC